MSAADKNIIAAINSTFGVALPESISLNKLREELAAYINTLVQSDFNKLVQLLYRIDVNEAKLKSMLKQNPGADAGLIIADLIIERQRQKLQSRKSFTKKDNEINEEDKW
ncbi:hypothetical protein [Terrimonas pollutisoli]|uniref:hypothetical protein n=1 Tax=Terrimonas pollutisoli TaxID=3034147 RepID=UPI0023EAA040|nr:hypothetical protein [Terrimonas sp. H1YJ31]